MASLDMSLDDVIKNRRNINRGGRGFTGPRVGRGRGRLMRGGRLFGSSRRNVLGINVRPSAFSIAKSVRRTRNLPWHNGMLEDSLKASEISGRDFSTKVHISNLDIGVTNEDIRELFSEIGELVRYAIHFNKNGRPSGTAEVVFAKRSDAFQALKRYNNVQLDGRPMKLEVIGDIVQNAVSPRVSVFGGANGQKRTVVMPTAVPSRSKGRITMPVNRTFVGLRGRGQGQRGASSRGRGRGRGGGKLKKSAEELDKELDTYHAVAMES